MTDILDRMHVQKGDIRLILTSCYGVEDIKEYDPIDEDDIPPAE